MSITLKEQTAASVSNPATGKKSLFIDSADHAVKTKDDTGAVEALGGGGATSADQVSVDASGFINNLSPADDTVQKALQTIDGMAGGGGTGVSSFNTRTGAVTSQNGDYTASQVGAEPSGAVSTHNSSTSAHGQTTVGRNVLTAATQAAGRTAIDAEQAGVAASTVSSHNALITAHGQTTVGRNVLTAVDAAAARTAIDAEQAGTAASAVSSHNGDTSAHGQTSVGRALVTAIDQAAGRSAISAETAGAAASAVSSHNSDTSAHGQSVVGRKVLIATSEEVARDAIGAQFAFNGIENGANFTVTYNESTRTVQVSYGANCFVWVNGIKYTKTGSESLTHSNTTGKHFFYYTAGGTFTDGMTPWDIATTAQLAYVYFNAETGKGFHLTEKHAAITGMSPASHAYNHFRFGTAIKSGFYPSGYTIPQVTMPSDIQWATTLGVIADEDLESQLNAVTKGGPYSIFRREGLSGAWVWDTVSTTGFLSDLTNPQYNEFTGVTWKQTQITVNSRWFNMYIVALPMANSNGVIVMQGQTLHTSLAAAQAEDYVTSMAGVTDMTTEHVFLYKLTYQRINTGTRIENTILAVPPAAIRSSTATSISGLQATAHPALSGRSDPDQHPASSISADTSVFNDYLTASEDTVQKALNKLNFTKKITISATEPVGAVAGDIWIDIS